MVNVTSIDAEYIAAGKDFPYRLTKEPTYLLHKGKVCLSFKCNCAKNCTVYMMRTSKNRWQQIDLDTWKKRGIVTIIDPMSIVLPDELFKW